MEFFYYAVPIFGLMWWYGGGKSWDIEGINFHPFSDTSFPNPSYHLKGNLWSKNSLLESKFRETKKNSLKFDNFAYAKTLKMKISFLKTLFFKPAEIYIDPLKLTESVTMIAPMGSGKTVTLNNLIAQPWYDRALINDEKSGDFYSKWGNKRKDILFCPYDARGSVWDVLSEDLEIVEFFIQNTIHAVTGGNQSFFTNDAKERYKQIARLTIDIIEPKEKWKFFINELQFMFDEVEKAESKSAKDVISTMKQVIEMLKLVKFQLEYGKKSFTIKDFFNKKNQSKLFMVNVDKYNLQLSVLFSAFTACFAMIHASEKETKTDFTFYCLDEYLSLKMSYEAKLLLHTKIRSKGGCLLCAMHYLPDEQKLKDLLTSSTYAYMIFSVKNENTRRFFDEQVGQFQYLVRKKVNNQYQEIKEKENILQWDEVDKLANDYQHITYLPQEGALFVAKSDYIDKKLINEPFIYDEEIENFYRLLNKEYLDKKIQTKNSKSAAQIAAEKAQNNEKSA
uniref:type IV secretion system DNA-binding domain-containing protein n=1 Tax=Aliarcobacter sp. TaxID=2321116 RepID=UPI0040487462